jgi:hypothetical protein
MTSAPEQPSPEASSPGTQISPASLISELKNPATYLTLASFIPTFWAIFFHSSGLYGRSVAVAILHIAAVLCGPIAAVAYAIAHAIKASAHESRLKEVESVVVSALVAVRQSGVSISGIEHDIISALSSVRGTVKIVPGPAGPAGPQGPAGRFVVVGETGQAKPI